MSVSSACWQTDVDLSRLSSFGVPARADFFVELEQEDELPALLNEADRKDLPVLILGGGSNLLLAGNFPGLVIKISLRGISVRADADAADNTRQTVLLTAAAGENWHGLVQYCLDHQLYGIENLALIPGNAGAAPVQNIGAYGVELSDVLHSVRYFDRQSQQLVQLTAAECQLAYRDSIFKHALKGRAVILSICLRLSRQQSPCVRYPALQQALQGMENPSARQIFDAVCAVRRSKLPDPAVLGNAGSFFRNPIITQQQYEQLLLKWPDLPAYPVSPHPILQLDAEVNTGNEAMDQVKTATQVKLPAAWLIERAGWKGMREGDAGVHTQQALVLVNYGKATGLQIVELAARVVSSVRREFGVKLEPEVNILPATAWYTE